MDPLALEVLTLVKERGMRSNQGQMKVNENPDKTDIINWNKLAFCGRGTVNLRKY